MIIFEGSQYTDRGLIWIKQCQCNGTASGPRLVIGLFDSGDRVTFEAAMPKYACDECNTPWKKAANGEGVGQ